MESDIEEKLSVADQGSPMGNGLDILRQECIYEMQKRTIVIVG